MLKTPPFAIAITACLFTFSNTLNAQTLKGTAEIDGGIGLVSTQQISIDLASERGPIIIDHSSPVFYLSGKYFLSRKLALGLSISTQTITGESNEDWTIPAGRAPFTYKMTNVNIAPEITTVYFHKKHFELYGLYGLSFAHSFVTYNYYSGGGDSYVISPNVLDFQITPLGLRFGSDVACYLEFGIGYKGLINGGICYSFGRQSTITH